MKLAFVHVRKNAGSSIKKFFENIDYPLVVFNHFPTDIVDKYFTFGVTRNPYDRCLSSWMYCSSTRYRPLNDCLDNPPKENDIPNEPWLTKGHDYRHFTLLQCDYLFNNERTQTVDYLLRYETLEQDLFTLCDHLMIKTKGCKLPRENVNYIRRNVTQEWLTDHQKEKIYNFYKEDFDKLGYIK